MCSAIYYLHEAASAVFYIHYNDLHEADLVHPFSIRKHKLLGRGHAFRRCNYDADKWHRILVEFLKLAYAR